MRWRRVPKQSCSTHSRNSATAFLLGQSGILAVSCSHGLWESLVSSSCLYTLWNTRIQFAGIISSSFFLLRRTSDNFCLVYWFVIPWSSVISPVRQQCAILHSTTALEKSVSSHYCLFFFDRLTPNDPYMGPTALLTTKRCILYIYSTNVGTEYFEHSLCSPFFSLQNAVCFVMLNCLVPVLFTFYIQNVLKLKKIIPAPKG